jgi:hypothetical protein
LYWVLLHAKAGLQNHTPIYSSQPAGMAGMCHHTQLFINRDEVS